MEEMDGVNANLKAAHHGVTHAREAGPGHSPAAAVKHELFRP